MWYSRFIWKKMLKKILRPQFLILLSILILGAFLRLYKIADYMTFLGDEGRDVLVVKRMIVDHKFTLLGPTASVGGFFLGPIYYYFMIPFLWLWRLDPVGPAVMVAFFGVATIFLVYKVGRDFFEERTGLFASLLYALSPLVIAHSRSSWNPNLMPFFSLLIIYLIWQVAVYEKWRFLFWVGFFLGIAFQLHYLATFLVFIVFLYLAFFGRNLQKWKEYLLGVGGFLVGWSPFLLFELRHNFPNFKTLWRFIFSSPETGFVTSRFWPIISDVLFRLFSRLMTHNNLFLAQIMLFLVLGVFFFQFFSRRKLAPFSLLSLWFIVGVSLFGFYQKPIYDYYLGFLFPLPFLLTGQVFSFLSQKSMGKILVAVLMAFLIFINWQGRPMRFIPNRQLKQTKDISRFILEKTEGKPFNFALITGQNSDHAYRYFFEIWGNKPLTIENPQIDPERKSVTDQLLIVCEISDCQPLGYSLWEVAGFGQAEIAGEWQVSVVKVFKLGHYKGS